MNTAREAIAETSVKFAEYNAKLDSYGKRITELQDALELAEETVMAKQQSVTKGWQLVPVEPTSAMLIAAGTATPRYRAMLAAAPKLGGE